LPVGVVYFWGNRGISQRAFQLEVLKMGQWLTAVVNQRLDQPQSSVDLPRGQANVVKHVISAAKKLSGWNRLCADDFRHHIGGRPARSALTGAISIAILDPQTSVTIEKGNGFLIERQVNRFS